jgi:hypothetical protein
MHRFRCNYSTCWRFRVGAGGVCESVSLTDCTYLLPASLIISIHGMYFYMRHALSLNHKNMSEGIGGGVQRGGVSRRDAVTGSTDEHK